MPRTVLKPLPSSLPRSKGWISRAPIVEDRPRATPTADRLIFSAVAFTLSIGPAAIPERELGKGGAILILLDVNCSLCLDSSLGQRSVGLQSVKGVMVFYWRVCSWIRRNKRT